MAAALIPIGLDLLGKYGPKLFDLIAGLVHKAAPIAEATHGPGTGPVKLSDVFGDVITKLQQAAVAGTIPKDLPSDDLVKLIIQAVVSSMKLAGLLDGSASAAPQVPPATGFTQQQYVLKPGQSLTILASAAPL